MATSRSLPNFLVSSRNCLSLGKVSELVLLVEVGDGAAAVVPG